MCHGLTLAVLLACSGTDFETRRERCFDLGLQQDSYEQAQRSRRELLALGVREADTAFAKWAPLRPSEKTWYDEHCWNKRPRDSTGAR